jgi:hypothetical protein
MVKTSQYSVKQYASTVDDVASDFNKQYELVFQRHISFDKKLQQLRHITDDTIALAEANLDIASDKNNKNKLSWEESLLKVQGVYDSLSCLRAYISSMDETKVRQKNRSSFMKNKSEYLSYIDMHLAEYNEFDIKAKSTALNIKKTEKQSTPVHSPRAKKSSKRNTPVTSAYVSPQKSLESTQVFLLEDDLVQTDTSLELEDLLTNPLYSGSLSADDVTGLHKFATSRGISGKLTPDIYSLLIQSYRDNCEISDLKKEFANKTASAMSEPKPITLNDILDDAFLRDGINQQEYDVLLRHAEELKVNPATELSPQTFFNVLYESSVQNTALKLLNRLQSVAPAPTPVRVEPTPNPTPAQADPAQTPVRVEPTPNPTPAQADPAQTPVRVEPTPNPTPAQADPAQTPVRVDPTPAPTPVHVDPAPAPTPVHVDPAPTPSQYEITQRYTQILDRTDRRNPSYYKGLSISELRTESQQLEQDDHWVELYTPQLPGSSAQNALRLKQLISNNRSLIDTQIASLSQRPTTSGIGRWYTSLTNRLSQIHTNDKIVYGIGGGLLAAGALLFGAYVFSNNKPSSPSVASPAKTVVIEQPALEEVVSTSLLTPVVPVVSNNDFSNPIEPELLVSLPATQELEQGTYVNRSTFVTKVEFDALRQKVDNQQYLLQNPAILGGTQTQGYSLVVHSSAQKPTTVAQTVQITPEHISRYNELVAKSFMTKNGVHLYLSPIVQVLGNGSSTEPVSVDEFKTRLEEVKNALVESPDAQKQQKLEELLKQVAHN